MNLQRKLPFERSCAFSENPRKQVIAKVKLITSACGSLKKCGLIAGNFYSKWVKN